MEQEKLFDFKQREAAAETTDELVWLALEISDEGDSEWVRRLLTKAEGLILSAMNGSGVEGLTDFGQALSSESASVAGALKDKLGEKERGKELLAKACDFLVSTKPDGFVEGMLELVNLAMSEEDYGGFADLNFGVKHVDLIKEAAAGNFDGLMGAAQIYIDLGQKERVVAMIPDLEDAASYYSDYIRLAKEVYSGPHAEGFWELGTKEQALVLLDKAESIAEDRSEKREINSVRKDHME